MKNFYLTVLCILFTLNSFSQTNTFENLYGDSNRHEIASSVVQMSDSSYVIAGYIYGYLFLKNVDKDGNEIWQREYDIKTSNLIEIIHPDSVSLIISGIYDSLFILKTNTEGEQLWYKKYPLTASLSFHQLKKGNDTGYMILQYSSVESLALLKINENGDSLWFKEYPIEPSLTFDAGITGLSSGGYIICGSKKIYKINDAGDIIWNKDVTQIMIEVMETSDNCLLFGTRSSVVKTNPDGDIIWELSQSNREISIAEVNNNYYIISRLDLLAKVIMIDAGGNLIWSKEFSGRANHLIETSDGNLVLCGIYRFDFDTDIWLLKIDPDGEYRDVLVLLPRQGNDLLAGNNFRIMWVFKNIQYLKIEFSTDNGATWNLINTNIVPDSGYYEWLVPPHFSEFCKLKLSDVSGDVYDINRGNFRILPASPYNFISVNDVLMWVGNNGDGSHDPNTNGGGFYWPKEGDEWTKSAIFQDGLVFGGKVNGEIRVNGNTHRAGLQSGIILPDGTPDTSSKALYGVWKLRKDWESLPPGVERDYNEYVYNNWPTDIGAPYEDINKDGEFTHGVDKPDCIGDMVLFYAANDMDSSKSTFIYGTLPMGLEFQTVVYGFDRDDDLKNVIFKKYKMINKGVNTIEDMFFGYWSDNDLGFAGDDFSGCDSVLDLSYTYNADNNDDNVYGTPPPAVGHKILQGPVVEGLPTDSAKFNDVWRKGYKNLSSYAFVVFICGDPYWCDPNPESSIEFYNNLNGFVWDGSPFINPLTGDTTKFVLTGDPYYQTGWYEGEGWPGGPDGGDRYNVISTGPFNFAPGDTQEVAVAILMAQGDDRVHSVYKLKQLAQLVQDFYDNDFVTSVDDIKPVPSEFSLSQNYPNPFNPSTRIKYKIPFVETNSDASLLVKLKVYDILGREVATLVNEEKQPGEYEVEFDASQLSSGIYFYRLQAREYNKTFKMIFLK